MTCRLKKLTLTLKKWCSFELKTHSLLLRLFLYKNDNCLIIVK